MEQSFWENKWARNEIGFHLPRPHPLLVRYWPTLSLPAESRVFVPLCGKALDLQYLLGKGHRVVGAELSRKAVEALFAQHDMTPTITNWAGGNCYQSEGLTVYQGDIFALDKGTLGQVDACYDRAALIALPTDMRLRYSAHLSGLTDRAPQLLITLSYNQNEMPGPPFSVDANEVATLYRGHDIDIQCLSSNDILEHEPGFRERGLTALQESCWLLLPNA